MISFVVRVVPSDIAAGIHGDCGNCPVARALSRTFQTPLVHVGGWGTFAGELEIKLPEEAVDWIRDFDRGRPVHPIQFNVQVI